MSVKDLDIQNRKVTLTKDARNNSQSKTTAIRISTDLYELLREKAFYDRTTIRQVADDILDESLNR